MRQLLFPVAVCVQVRSIKTWRPLLVLCRGAPVDHVETLECRERGPVSSFQKSESLLACYATRGTLNLSYTMSGRSKPTVDVHAHNNVPVLGG